MTVKTIFISCALCSPAACQPGWTTDEGALSFSFAASASLLSLDHKKGKHASRSYLFLVPASNGNEADYASEIDNFMLPN